MAAVIATNAADIDTPWETTERKPVGQALGRGVGDFNQLAARARRRLRPLHRPGRWVHEWTRELAINLQPGSPAKLLPLSAGQAPVLM